MNSSNQPFRNPYAPIQPNQYYPSNQPMMENDNYPMKVNLKHKFKANTLRRMSPSPDPRDPRLAV